MGYDKEILMGVHNNDIENNLKEMRCINTKIKKNVSELKEKVLDLKTEEGMHLEIIFKR